MIDNEALLKWVQDNNIKARTIEYFWDTFNDYKNDLPKEEFEIYFDGGYENYIKLWFRSISQRVVFLDYLDRRNENVDVIEASLRVGYKDDRCYGTYSVYYDLSGNITDCTLGCEWEKWYINLRKEILEEFKIEFSNTAAAEGIECELASKIISKTIDKINKEWDDSESS